MKKLINDPAVVVDEMLAGLCLVHPSLALLEGERVLVRSDLAAFAERGHVALISGGGSGHEPAHAGYVGQGLLTAAVCGDVFTSPSTDAVLAAIRAVAGPGGVLLIVKNYTGDRLNFGLAAEIARGEGFAVEMVVVADDVALGTDTDNAGRRGIAGTVLVHKVAGARAAEGASLADVRAAAERAIAGLGSMGVALSACTVPAAGKPSFELGEREVELGLGIHGEAGVRREPLRPSRALAETLVDRIVAELALQDGEPVALLVNNLGATPVMEIQIVAQDAVAAASAHGLRIERLWAGTFLTALEMAGCSLTLLRIDGETLRLLDAPAFAPAWPGRGAGPLGAGPAIVVSPRRGGQAMGQGDGTAIVAALRAAASGLIEEEGRLTALDQKVGDGDLGLNLARGADVALKEMDGWERADAASILRALSASLRRSVGGTSGALYAAGLLRAARELDGIAAPTASDWAVAFAKGAEAIAQLGDTKPGDRTMLDALLPAAEALRAGKGLGAALDAARDGAAATASMAPRRGRSSYLGDRAVGIPDPGAEAVVVWLGAIHGSLGGR